MVASLIATEAHVVEEEFTRARTVNSHLAQRLRLDETRHAAIEDEGQDLAVALLDPRGRAIA
jgi:hypothetical protein